MNKKFSMTKKTVNLLYNVKHIKFQKETMCLNIIMFYQKRQKKVKQWPYHKLNLYLFVHETQFIVQ